MTMHRIAGSLVIAFALVGIASPAIASSSPTGDAFDQRTFPCQEDEVLGYAPQFGPDRVGCIHIDQLH